MNIASIVGIVGIFAALIIGILWGGNSLNIVVDISSVFIVIVCSISILIFAATRFSESLDVFKMIRMSFKTPNFGEQEIARKLIAFSEKARREGLLSLEEEIQDVDNEFLRTGLRLSIDGTDRDVILNLLEIEVNKMNERHAKKYQIFDLWGTVAPACGMWGTLIGLIGMMRNLSNPELIGPNMAVALVTTLYGSVLANGIAIPTGKKLRGYDADETNCREMIIEGVLSIQSGDNPRILGQKLLAYLTPEDRKALEHEVKTD